MSAILAAVLRFLTPILKIFAPQIIAGFFTLLKDGFKFIYKKVSGYFKKKEYEKNEAEVIEQEKNAKTKEEQENAAKAIIDHANGD